MCGTRITFFRCHSLSISRASVRSTPAGSSASRAYCILCPCPPSCIMHRASCILHRASLERYAGRPAYHMPRSNCLFVCASPAGCNDVRSRPLCMYVYRNSHVDPPKEKQVALRPNPMMVRRFNEPREIPLANARGENVHRLVCYVKKRESP